MIWYEIVFFGENCQLYHAVIIITCCTITDVFTKFFFMMSWLYIFPVSGNIRISLGKNAYSFEMFYESTQFLVSGKYGGCGGTFPLMYFQVSVIFISNDFKRCEIACWVTPNVSASHYCVWHESFSNNAFNSFTFSFRYVLCSHQS